MDVTMSGLTGLSHQYEQTPQKKDCVRDAGAFARNLYGIRKILKVITNVADWHIICNAAAQTASKIKKSVKSVALFFAIPDLILNANKIKKNTQLYKLGKKNESQLIKSVSALAQAVISVVLLGVMFEAIAYGSLGFAALKITGIALLILATGFGFFFELSSKHEIKCPDKVQNIQERNKTILKVRLFAFSVLSLGIASAAFWGLASAGQMMVFARISAAALTALKSLIDAIDLRARLIRLKRFIGLEKTAHQMKEGPEKIRLEIITKEKVGENRLKIANTAFSIIMAAVFFANAVGVITLPLIAIVVMTSVSLGMDFYVIYKKNSLTYKKLKGAEER